MTTPHAQMHPLVAFLCMALLFVGSVVMLTGCAEEQARPAADEQEVTMDPIASGKVSYEQYCQGCHGADGKGTGEIGADLAGSPADLTQLTARYGSFPVDSVYQAIDGRKDVEAHGSREMPVWGNIWGEEGGAPVADEVVGQRINELVEYIRSIQG